jgi:hypothetical protein
MSKGKNKNPKVSGKHEKPLVHLGELTRALPKALQSSLPNIEQTEKELEGYRP